MLPRMYVCMYVFTSLGDPHNSVAMMPSVNECTIVQDRLRQSCLIHTAFARSHCHIHRVVTRLMTARLNLLTDSSVSSGGSELYSAGARR